MDKLTQLKNEIAEKQKQQEEKLLADTKHSQVVKGFEKVAKKISDTAQGTFKVNVVNQNEFPTDIKVNNLGDIKLPSEVKVSNLKDIKLPTPPSEVSIKEPKWFSLKGVIKEIKDLRTALAKAFDFDFEQFKKKQNAIAVRLVTQDGASFYNAGGGGSASSASTIPTALIHTNTHTGSSELRVYQENHICLQNTTTALLGANETFTGQWQDCLNYQEVNVSIVASHNSATNGLVIQWSADGVNVGDTDVFSYYAASGGTNYTPNPAFRYVRLVYTNGATQQTSFSLMTILRRSNTGGSFHRIDSTLKDDADARLTLTVPKLKTAANTYVSQQATTAGNAKVSIEEFDAALATNPLPVKITDGTDIAEVIAGANTGVKGLRVYGGPTDPISDIPVIMEFDHHQIHEGEAFRYGFYTASLGNGANKDIRFTVPNIDLTGSTAVVKCPHFRWEVISSVGGVAYIYEGTTWSNNGTTRTPVAVERNGTYSPKMTLGEDATPNVIGTQIWVGVNLASKTQAGATDSPTSEFVLKNNTSYHFRFTSAVASNQVLIRFFWYEDLGV